MTDKPKWTDLFGIDPDYTKDAVEEPKYTESDMQVLTETASKVGYALGRKDAGAEIAAAIEAKVAWFREAYEPSLAAGCSRGVEIALEVASQAAPDATSGRRTDPGEDS